MMSTQENTKNLPLLDEQLFCDLKGNFARGKEIANFLERTTPDCPRATFNRSWYKIIDGDLLEGLKLLDSGRWIKVFGDNPLQHVSSLNCNNWEGIFFTLNLGLRSTKLPWQFIRKQNRKVLRFILSSSPVLSSYLKNV